MANCMLNHQMVYPPSINLSDLSLVRSMVGFLVAYPGYPDSSMVHFEKPLAG